VHERENVVSTVTEQDVEVSMENRDIDFLFASISRPLTSGYQEVPFQR
jgi:hypothetical protein